MEKIEVPGFRLKTPEMMQRTLSHYWNSKAVIGAVRKEIVWKVGAYKPWTSRPPLVQFTWIRVVRRGEGEGKWHASI